MKARAIASAPWRGVKALSQMIFPTQGGSLSWLFRPRRVREFAREVGDGSLSSAVMACLNYIVRTYPEAPPMVWELSPDGEEEMVADHELLRLLQRPNPYYSGPALLGATLMDYELGGDAYWAKVRRSRTGSLAELWWLPASTMEPKGDENTFITHYEYRVGARVARLEPEDVVHFRNGLDPENPRKGRSPLACVLAEVFSDEEAASFTASLLRNMGVPGIIISPELGEKDLGPTDAEAKATKEYVFEQTTGANRGKPLVMKGQTRVQQFGFSPEQMNLKDIRRVPEERISAVIGIPAIVAGLGAGLDRSTFANMAEAREMAYESKIIPTQRLFGEEIRFQLLPDFGDDPHTMRVGHDLRKVRVLQEDENKLMERLAAGVKAGFIEVGEARTATGYEARPGDAIFLRPLAVIEVPSGEVRSLAPLQDGPPAKGREPAAPKQLPPGELKGAAGDRLIQTFQRQAAVLEAAFAAELDQAFTELGDLAAAAYESQKATNGDGHKSVSRETRKAEEDDQADERLAHRIAAALRLSDWKASKLLAVFKTAYRRTLGETVKAINTTLELGVMIPEETELRIIEGGGTRLGLVDIEAGTRIAILRALKDGREAGDGPVEIARRIREQVPAGRFVNAGPKYRATLIARTETLHAQRVASLAAYDAAPDVRSVVAYDARLADSDPECIARDGQEFTIAEAEVEAAGEHPQGTLAFAPVVADTILSSA